MAPRTSDIVNAQNPKKGQEPTTNATAHHNSGKRTTRTICIYDNQFRGGATARFGVGKTTRAFWSAGQKWRKRKPVTIRLDTSSVCVALQTWSEA
eukprot:4942646-Pleurochrysis_carterae.AAC.1